MAAAQRVLGAARVLTAAAGGCAVALAFPPYDQIWLMPVGIAALLVLTRRRRARAGFGYGWAFGFGFMLVLMPWLQVIGYDAWVALAVVEGFFYALVGLSWAWLSWYRWWAPAAAAAWVGAELLRSTVPFGGLPWGRLAFGLAETPFDRYGRLGGTALVAFIAVLAVALAVEAASRGRLWSRTLLGAVAVGVVLVSAVLPVGLAGAGGQVRVAAVQGDVPGEGLKAFAQRRAVLDNHATATRAFAALVAAGTAQRPDFAVWPENSSDIDPFRDQSAFDQIDGAVAALQVPVLVGAVLQGPDADHVQNAGIVWSPTTGPGQRYFKRHLVPFGEFIPYRSVLTKVISRLNQIPKDFAPGDTSGVLTIAGTPIGDLMCFEVAYDDLVRGLINDGGRLLVVQTNNATYAGTGQLEQQFAVSRYRAVETGRQVVIASINGISGFVSATGAVLDKSSAHTQVVLERRVTLADGTTWGVRLGGLLSLGLALVALVATLGAAVGSRRRRGTIGW